MVKNNRYRKRKQRKRRTTNIYVITAGRYFYVGKANNPWARLEIHKARAVSNEGKNKRKNKMLKANYRNIKMTILEKPKMTVWRERERHWIAHYRSKYGYERVLNISSGGDGQSGYGYDDRPGTSMGVTLTALLFCGIVCYVLYAMI